MNTDNIHAWLKELGYKIAEHAEPLKGVGGDHDYDGAIDVVWEGIHEALGVKTHNCDLWTNTGKCQLSQHGHGITYTGPTQPHGPRPSKSSKESFLDGYTWARVITQVYDLNAALNKTQETILEVALDHAERDHSLMQAIIDSYRNQAEDQQ